MHTKVSKLHRQPYLWVHFNSLHFNKMCEMERTEDFFFLIVEIFGHCWIHRIWRYFEPKECIPGDIQSGSRPIVIEVHAPGYTTYVWGKACWLNTMKSFLCTISKVFFQSVLFLLSWIAGYIGDENAVSGRKISIVTYIQISSILPSIV